MREFFAKLLCLHALLLSLAFYLQEKGSGSSCEFWLQEMEPSYFCPYLVIDSFWIF